MEYEKNVCPVLDIDGVLATGKQFDLNITLPEDNRSVVYGVVKDCYQEPISNAVVKLVEVVCECGKEERRPVSHTFTDKEGEFVFGPLCANKFYEIQIWVDKVRHCKVCTTVKHEGKCLKGIKLDCPKADYKKPEKHYDEYFEKKCDEKYDDKYEKKYDDKYEDKYEDKCEKKYDDKYYDKCEKKYDDKYEDKYEKKHDEKYEDKCEKKCEDKYDDKHDDKCEKKHEDKNEDKCKNKCEDKYENKCERPCYRPFGRPYGRTL